MSSFWLNFRHSLAFRQLALLGLLMVSGVCMGQSCPVKKVQKRLPASYVPDDDVIISPVANEVSFYHQHIASDESSDVVKARNQIKVWNDNQIFAEQYGLRTTLVGSPYFSPTPEQKWDYFKDKYFRYLRQKGEQPFKDMPKNWYQEYRASNEVDTIDEIESRFKKSNEKSSGEKMLPKSLQAKEVSLWKKTSFIFQPRVDMGIVVVGFKTPFAYARAWVGVNGKTEVNVQQTYDSIGMRAMFNYYADSGEYFTSVDQRIINGLYARYTRSNKPSTDIQDDTLMLLYAKQF